MTSNKESVKGILWGVFTILFGFLCAVLGVIFIPGLLWLFGAMAIYFGIKELKEGKSE